MTENENKEGEVKKSSKYPPSFTHIVQISYHEFSYMTHAQLMYMLRDCKDNTKIIIQAALGEMAIYKRTGYYTVSRCNEVLEIGNCNYISRIARIIWKVINFIGEEVASNEISD